MLIFILLRKLFSYFSKFTTHVLVSVENFWKFRGNLHLLSLEFPEISRLRCNDFFKLFICCQAEKVLGDFFLEDFFFKDFIYRNMLAAGFSYHSKMTVHMYEMLWINSFVLNCIFSNISRVWKMLYRKYRKTSNNIPPLIIRAPLKFQKKVSSTSNNSRPLIIPATIFRGNRLTVRKNNRLN